MATKQLSNNRPVRKTAGKRVTYPDYVNSIEVIQDALGDLKEENKELLNTARGRGRKRKRPRSISPVAHPLIPFDVVNDTHFPSPEDSPTPERVEAPSQEPVTLVFNIPTGFVGPLKVEFDPAQFVRQVSTPPPRKPHYVVEPAAKRRKLALAEAGGKDAQRARKLTRWTKRYGEAPRGFLDLPPEIRNQIYRLVFVSKAVIDFSGPTNCERSAALLRTCKQVHKEGVSVLYSENRFTFHRNRSSRVPFWISDSREIGYLDMRHFLTMIGETGRAFLRRFHIVLEDANKLTAWTDPEGRFTHDANLLACFKLLAVDSVLKTMALTFQGKRKVSTSDVRFIEALSAVEVDNVIFNPSALWSGDRFEARVKDILQKEMIRPEPLYDDEHRPRPEHCCSWGCYRYW